MDREKHIAVIGAGLAGIVAAMFLRRRGHRVTLFDKRSDPRFETPRSDRTLTLTLTKRGLDALDRLGVAEPIIDASVPLAGRIVHHENGEVSRQSFDDQGNTLHLVQRGALLAQLHARARAAFDLEYRYEARVDDIALDAGRLTVWEGDRSETLQFDAIIGADGAFSAVRGAMQRRWGFDYEQEFSRYAIRETLIGPNPILAATPGTDHVWPRSAATLIAFPNTDSSATLVLLLPATGRGSAEQLYADGRSGAFFAETFPDMAPLVPDIAAALGRRAPEPMVSIKCGPWFVGGTALIIGDAAHACYASTGQGANAAFEDAMILDACLDETGDDFEAAFRAFYQRRKPATDALTDAARKNELAPVPTAPKSEPLHTRIRSELRKVYPGIGYSLYGNIAFTHMPYDLAYATEAAVGRAVAELASALNDNPALPFKEAS